MFYFNMVGEFHNKYELPTAFSDGSRMFSHPTVMDPDVFNYRMNFIKEELNEAAEAEDALNRLEVPWPDMLPAAADLAKELVDVVYVAMGTLHFMNFPAALAFGNNLTIWGKGCKSDDSTWHKFSRFLFNAEGAHRTGNVVQLAVSMMQIAGAAHARADDFNFPFQRAFTAVHDANMLKVRVEKASDSKRGTMFDVVKPPGWEPADVAKLLDLCGWSMPA